MAAAADVEDWAGLDVVEDMEEEADTFLEVASTVVAIADEHEVAVSLLTEDHPTRTLGTLAKPCQRLEYHL